MAEAGILGPDDRVELLEGEVVRMSPIGYRHALIVARFARMFTLALQDRAEVWTQNPVVLDDHSEPEPDVAVIRREHERDLRDHPWASDTFLIVEVADTSLRHDRDVKLPLYAAAGVPEVWLVDLIAANVTVYRRPHEGRYESMERLERSQNVTPQAFPDLSVGLDDLLR